MSSRRAGVADAGVLAQLLVDFNTEFDAEHPPPDVLERRLAHLLTDDAFRAFLIGSPALGCAVVTLRPGVWSDGRVAMLDELYVVPGRRGQGLGSALLAHIAAVLVAASVQVLEVTVDGEDLDAKRFYEQHAFSAVDPGHELPMGYLYREL